MSRVLKLLGLKTTLGLIGVLALVAFFEATTLGLLWPLIDILMAEEQSDNRAQVVLANLGIQVSLDELKVISIAFFVLFICCSYVSRVICIFAVNRAIHGLRHRLSCYLFTRLINAKYQELIQYQLSDFENSVLSEVDLFVSRVVSPFLMFLSSGIVTISIISILLVTEPVLGIAVGIIVSSFIMIFYLSTGNSVANHGTTRFVANQSRFATVTEVFGNIEYICSLPRNLIQKFVDKYSGYSAEVAKSMATKLSITQTPRVILELLIVTGVLAFTLTLSFSDQLSSIPKAEFVSLLLALGFAVVKTLPFVQHCLSALLSLHFAAPLMDIFSDIERLSERSLNGRMIDDPGLMNSVQVRSLVVKYEEKSVGPISMTFTNPGIHLLRGPSGSGKSTVLKVLAGLLDEYEGEVFITLKKKSAAVPRVSYVPQKVALFTGTLRENLDVDNVHSDGFLSQILSILDLWDDFRGRGGLDFYIDNLGQNLSGGQRQRIGLGRTLCQKPDLLLLDETLGGVPKDVEARILRETEMLLPSSIIIMVSHRDTAGTVLLQSDNQIE